MTPVCPDAFCGQPPMTILYCGGCHEADGPHVHYCCPSGHRWYEALQPLGRAA